MQENTLEILKSQQFAHFNELVTRLENDDPIVKSWFQFDTTDFWRHMRMRTLFESLFSDAARLRFSVLTVGDGRFGSDAISLGTFGIEKIVASDLQGSSLEYAKKKGLIDEFLMLDLEKISLNDNSFDYIFCKESLHHLPRPYLGLYEMVRVAKKGVMLIEPAGVQSKNFLGTCFLAFQRIFRKRPIFFEDSGNYVFELRISEIEQFCLANGIERFSYKFFNDHYIEGVEFDKLGYLFKKIRFYIFIKNMRDFVLSRHSSMISLVIHDNSEDEKIISGLNRAGFKTWSHSR